jgi:ATP-dependent helicase YprA (DUF1998 family)
MSVGGSIIGDKQVQLVKLFKEFFKPKIVTVSTAPEEQSEVVLPYEQDIPLSEQERQEYVNEQNYFIRTGVERTEYDWLT